MYILGPSVVSISNTSRSEKKENAAVKLNEGMAGTASTSSDVKKQSTEKYEGK